MNSKRIDLLIFQITQSRSITSGTLQLAILAELNVLHNTSGSLGKADLERFSGNNHSGCIPLTYLCSPRTAIGARI